MWKRDTRLDSSDTLDRAHGYRRAIPGPGHGSWLDQGGRDLSSSNARLSWCVAQQPLDTMDMVAARRIDRAGHEQLTAKPWPVQCRAVAASASQGWSLAAGK
ncbi:hypothetical protein CDD81_670 [Ophiocordyceps australis]|uniref:Uncharacterized protein n=1 Tax=Ophiocordyceps australis TaxID=1399860 RepID=A0A2C5Y0N5_9HYPO|nr:hypothetical protein CDD81_670 [Ophiocordyceps australis]